MPHSTLNMKLGTCYRRRPRRAVTIVEVLFAILVATVGVFSVIVIFPFASAQAKRSRLNDMFAAAGRSAFHDVDARGMRIPDHLMAWDQGNGSFQSLNELTQLNQPDFVWTAVSPMNFQRNEAFCIDPRFIAANYTPAAGLPAWCRTFPYQEPFTDTNGDGVCQGSEFTASSGQDLNGNGVHDPYQDPSTFDFNPAFLPTPP